MTIEKIIKERLGALEENLRIEIGCQIETFMDDLLEEFDALSKAVETIVTDAAA